MKLLLDENLTWRLRREIVGHEVFTAAYMGWSGVKNGKLLQKAFENEFDALLTLDRGIEYEQDLDRLPISVIVLVVGSSSIHSIRPVLPTLLRALENLKPRSVVRLSPY